ncbi:MAG: heparinase II/III-family protein, partial [Candidatus Sumerlaeaceae bacterium]|nr:heparinase II/III-family protein [Candidatus Sumerlaeaceae bacterium]
MRFLIAASLPLAQPKAISSKRLFAFPATGLAVYHSALQYPQHNVQWMLRASPLGNLSHSHCDQLGVVISAYGDPIFVNTGFRDYYDSPFCREWYWHTRSHNALLLGGEGQRRGPEATARLLRWDDSAAVVWAVADGTRAYSGLASRVERYVASVPSPNGHVIALLDDVETSAVNVIACWHTRQKPVLRPLASQLEVQTTNARVLVQFFSQAEIELSLTDRYSTEPSVVSHAAGSGRHEWHVGTNLTYP